MKLEFTYQFPHTSWSVFHVFNNFYNDCLNTRKDIEISSINSSDYYIGNPGAPFSPHILTIKNLETNKYIIVSYWDHPKEFTFESHGWINEDRIKLITSSGVKDSIEFTPFSYLPYTTLFDTYSENAKPLEMKENNELIFRGFLYGDRLSLSNVGKIKILNDKIYPESSYFDDLTNNKICLSLNGAGEICNRDIEILSARSVLFRPKLNQKFHNELISGYHYVGFDYSSDPETQIEIILNEYNKIKDDNKFLKFISDNGYEWYKKNGTINSNVEILKKIINLDLLY
jgi:hypothetical protein